MIVNVNVYAATAGSEITCGMSVDDSGMVVQKESTRICDNDIALNSIYILFHKILDSDKIAPVFEGMYSVSDGTKEFAYSTGIGDSIEVLFQSLSTIIITFTLIAITYSVGKIIYQTSSNGEFMGSGQAKVFPVIFSNLLVILLLTPVGSILVVQLLVLIIAVIAIMIGNYFWSSFLYSTQVKSTEAVLNPEITISQAEDISAEFIGTAACMERTNQYILNNQYLDDTDYEENKLNIDHTLNQSFERIEQCLKYYVQPIVNGDALVSGYNFIRPNILFCDGKTTMDAVSGAFAGSFFSTLYTLGNAFVYNDVDYGQEHNCGTITYTQPSIADLNPKENNAAYTNMFTGNFVRNMLNEVNGTVSAASYFADFSNMARNNITELVEGTVTDESKRALYATYDSKIESIVPSIRSKIQVDAEYKEDPKMAGKYLYLKATGVLNQLLGAKYINTSIGAVDDLKALGRMTFIGGEDFKNKGMNTLVKDGVVNDILEQEYGVEVLINQSKLIYDYLEQAHCANNWSILQSSRRTVMAMKEGFRTNDDVSDVLDDIDNKPNFECIKITRKGGDYDIEYNIEGLSEQEKYKDFEIGGNGDSSGANKEELLLVENKLKTVVYLDKMKRATIERLLLDGYIYYVKMAVSKALTEELKLLQDESLLIKMRQEGWSTAGSMMLQVTMSQGNATVFKNGLLKSGLVMSEVYPQDSGETYANIKSLLNEDRTEEIDKAEESKGNFFKLTNFRILEFLYPGKSVIDFSNRASFEQAKENNQSAVVDGFLATIEEQLFSPIIYIKQASGIAQGTTLMKGLEDCRNENKVCVSHDTHPLNALMMFGQDLMANAIIILIIDLIVQAVSLAIDTAMGDTDSGVKNKNKGFFKEVLSSLKTVLSMPFKGILVALQAISSVLTIMRPIIYTFLFAGIFLGFILPTVPYIAFAIVFLGWLISIFMMMVISPIYVLLAAFSGNTKEQLTFAKLWELTGGILLKPALVTISLIFGWTLSSISLFYVNATIFSLFSATRPDSMLLGVVYTALTYIVYISLVFIVIQHSFKVINKLSDDILSLLNVRGSGDSQFIDNLGVEKFLQAKIMSDTVSNIHGQGANTLKGKQSALDRDKKRAREEKLAAMKKAEADKNS